MGTILCATRGGEASLRTQEAAIRRAKEQGDHLIFFYTFDMEFLAFADYAMRSDVVSEEMDKMAEFLMTMAVERAWEEGVNARYLIKRGAFAEQLRDTAVEEKVNLVVLGRPGDDESAFALEPLQKLAQELQAETNIPFCILPD
jgi:hypothetical protein